MADKNRKAFASMDFDTELGGQFAFSDHDSAYATFHVLYCLIHKPFAELARNLITKQM